MEMLTLILIAAAILLLIVVMFFIMKKKSMISGFWPFNPPNSPVSSSITNFSNAISLRSENRQFSTDTDIGNLTVYHGNVKIWSAGYVITEPIDAVMLTQWTLMIDNNNTFKLVNRYNDMVGWKNNVNMPGKSILTMQNDGNLVQRVNGKVVWSTFGVV